MKANKDIVGLLLTQAFQKKQTDRRFVDESFVDRDVEPYPAGRDQLFSFHEVLGQSFSASHRSVETEDGHVIGHLWLCSRR